MNQQRDFIDETFHVLAQPITALRATAELGLSESTEAPTAKQALRDCLELIDLLVQELAVLREIAGLDEAPPLHACDGRELLQSCVEEMAPVALNRGIAIRLDAEPVAIQCDRTMLERALFVALDEMIGSTPSGAEISISLVRHPEGAVLELRPSTLRGQRRTLCLKLMQFAGSSSTRSVAGCMSATFQGSSCKHSSAISLTGDEAAVSHESLSKNEVTNN
jgi:hypothetical protein